MDVSQCGGDNHRLDSTIKDPDSFKTICIYSFENFIICTMYLSHIYPQLSGSLSDSQDPVTTSPTRSSPFVLLLVACMTWLTSQCSHPRKSDSPYATNYQLPEAPQLRGASWAPSHWYWNVTWIDHIQVTRAVCELTGVMAALCPEDVVLEHPFPFSGSYICFVFCSLIYAVLWVGFAIDAPFRAEYAIIYFLCFVHLWVSVSTTLCSAQRSFSDLSWKWYRSMAINKILRRLFNNISI